MDVIRVEDQYYILASSSLAADDRPRVLKHGETFAVFNRYGDIQPLGVGEQGIFHEGTRYLSQLNLSLGKASPLLLSSAVREDNVLLAVDLTNPDVRVDGQIAVPRGTVHIYRSKFLWQAVCYEEIRLSNYGLFPVEVSFILRFDADYADVFEIRGQKRERKGRRLEEQTGEDCVVLAYQGLDNVIRRTILRCNPAPQQLTASEMRFSIRLEPKDEIDYLFSVCCESQEQRARCCVYPDALKEATASLKHLRAQDTEIYTSNEQFNDWVNRSLADLNMMITTTPAGLYPYAGVPWFSTPFGRDGVITALESLWINPDIARGVLAYLAQTQATAVLPEQDAEPGKILHETRKGEMVALNEVPFRQYYGSVDSTPLFIMLAGAYYQHTGDRAFIEALWPNIEAALKWIDVYGDRDGDGFVEYYRLSPKGLVQQGWKDSKDSVFHANGELADGPIALCEVQGYVYAARLAAAELASAFGLNDRAEELSRQALVLQRQFERDFWCERISSYALALDGGKRPCQVRTSNAGQCLFTGIASQERALGVADGLVGPDCFSGWGIRTVACSEARYNPMSYHNGSIWPHDNALIAAGMARYGLKQYAAMVLTGLFDAAIFVDLHRLPELFCGFARRPGKAPTLYPVACSPQAWSSAAIFMLLQACLGLSISGLQGRVCFSQPYLPESIEMVELRKLKVGGGWVDLVLHRYGYTVGVNVKKREGAIKVSTVQ